MRKIYVPVLAVALFASSCQKEDVTSKQNLSLELNGLSSPVRVLPDDGFYESTKGQTPIDIRESACQKSLSNDPVFHYDAIDAVVKHNTTHYGPGDAEENPLEHDEYNLKVVPTDLKKDFITMNGKKYYLKQFHFHYGSEHALNGKKFDMEVHLVHMDDDGHFAVVGVFIEKRKENEVLHKIFSESPDPSGIHGSVNDGRLTAFNPLSLLPNDLKHYFTYSGSLTTPSYSEELKWVVFKSAISVSKEEYAHYTEIYEEPNVRPLQSIGNRVVLVHGNGK